MLSQNSIHERIQQAIAPQLRQLDHLIDSYTPRIIGKHHPEYDTLFGRLHYQMRRFGTVEARSVEPETVLGTTRFQSTLASDDKAEEVLELYLKGA